MMYRLSWLLLLILPLLTTATPALYAGSKEDRVQFGRSIVVDENEEVDDAVCIGCSIRMVGTAYGDVVSIGGSVRIEGKVKGDAVAVGGSLLLDENATVGGDAVAVGGRLSRHPNAVVKGEVTNESGPFILLATVLVPLVPVFLVVVLLVWLLRPKRPKVPARA